MSRRVAPLGLLAALLLSLAGAGCGSSPSSSASIAPPPSGGGGGGSNDGGFGGLSTDGGATTDGGTIVVDPGDGGTTPDGGTVSDGGPATDGGTTPDGGTTVDAGVPDGPLGGGDWLQYRHDPTGCSSNAGVFTADDARSLTATGGFEVTIGDNFSTGESVVSQPLVTADTIYVTTAFGGRVLALDTSPGTKTEAQRTRWSQTFNSAVGAMGPQGFWAAPAIAGGVLYAAAADGRIHALNAATGAELWSVAVADPSVAAHGEFIETSPAVSVALGKLYVGIATSDKHDPINGKVASVDLATHAVRIVPVVPAGLHGGSVWASISIDEAADRIYAATGNHLDPIEQEPLSQSIIAFDAQTLDVLDHWQNPTALNNSDFGSSPALFEAADGTKLIAASSKDGWLYAFRRESLAAGPVWKRQLAVVDPAAPTEGGDPTAGFGSIVSPTFAHGTLFAAGGRTPGGDVGSVVALDPATGALKWSAPHVTAGYVMTAMAAVGDVLIVESNSGGHAISSLEILDQATGAQLKRIDGTVAAYGAPSVGHGMVVWIDAAGHAQGLVAPRLRGP